ncbi:MAG: patatin-like phospholipase family protein, partial [Calditrichaeota bacterium]|nr:patatin-like phospholipase family protein [Calditrichota bacterium]
MKTMTKLSRQTVRLLLIVLWIASGSQHLFAQPETPFRPKIGLVFSGGGAKGFAHIGVLKVLEEIGMPIDCISGNSMGSIVGGLYAIGYRAADLEKIATQTDWDVVLKDRVERSALSMEQKFYDARYNVSLDLDGLRVKLPSGLISGQNVVRLLNRLTQPVQHIRDFTQFPIPFVCVATNIVTGEAVVLKSGSLAESIRASMAIPSAFTPIEIDGKLLVDGMIARNFPVQEAREVLGAEVVIGVDVGEELADEDGLDSFLSIMNQAVSFQMVKSTLEQRKLCNYLITPEVSEHGFAGSFGNAEYFIAQGEKAAREMLPQLQALLQSIKHLPDEPENGEKIIYHAASPEDLILIAEVEIEGLQRLPRNFVMERLQIAAPAHISLAEVENGVDRVFGSQFFERVSYELAPNANGKRLILHV